MNDKEVHFMNENLKGDKNHEYGVEWGLAHHMYIKLAEHTNDIGLYRLDKDVIIRQRFRSSLTYFLFYPSYQDWIHSTNLSSYFIF